MDERIAARHVRPPDVTPPAPPPPEVDLAALDQLELLPDQPVSTLLGYVRVLDELRGGDVLARLAARGLDPVRWAACAAAWSQLLGTRADLVQRLAVLMRRM